ncbi:MAG: SRPBCC family protein [Gemmatimonadales bacterium]|nr:MAG: SRPBCC family protein [Gemmatimonadales bacterium]
MHIDVSRQIGAVTRRVETRTREDMPVFVIRAERTFDTPLDDTWDAITNPERLSRWFLPVSGDFRPGGSFRIEGNASGEILRCDPPEELAVTWVFNEQLSWVDLFLTAEGDEGTRLVLEHLAPVDPEFQARYGPGAGGVGWEQAFMGLDLYLTSGEPGDPEAYAAWSASPEGLAMVEQSSEAWGHAAIAAGTDPEEAHAAARRTTAFYTGAEAG